MAPGVSQRGGDDAIRFLSMRAELLLNFFLLIFFLLLLVIIYIPLRYPIVVVFPFQQLSIMIVVRGNLIGDEDGDVVLLSEFFESPGLFGEDFGAIDERLRLTTVKFFTHNGRDRVDDDEVETKAEEEIKETMKTQARKQESKKES